MMPADAKRELARLKRTFEYAFAFSTDPGIRNHPDSRAVRERVADLLAVIQEHETA